MSTDAEIFNRAPPLVGVERPELRASETTTAAAAPSPVGEHIGSLFGYAIISAFLISSSVNRCWYCASGFSVECAWFFSATRVELVEPDARMRVRVLGADEREPSRHEVRAEDALDIDDCAVASRRFEHVAWLPVAQREEAHLAHLLHPDREPDVALPATDRHDHGAEGGGSGTRTR